MVEKYGENCGPLTSVQVDRLNSNIFQKAVPQNSYLDYLKCKELFRYDTARQGCTKLVSVVSRIPDKLLMVRQMTLKITTKKVGPNP